MTVASKVLLVELVMSIDRLIESAKKAEVKAGEWSPTTVLGHVSQVDAQVWQPRVQQMVSAQAAGDPEPEFSWWEPDANETAVKFQDHTLDEAAAIAMQVRTQLVTYLNTLTPDQWDARATHATFGSMDVRELIFQTLTHDEEHRASFL